MKATFEFRGYQMEITTEHVASRYDEPVLLVDGELTDVVVELDDDDPTDVDGSDDYDVVSWPENRPD